MLISAKPETRLYLLSMRVSVILTDLVYFFACYKLCCVLGKGGNTWASGLGHFIALYVNLGLILIDNIHF